MEIRFTFAKDLIISTFVFVFFYWQLLKIASITYLRNYTIRLSYIYIFLKTLKNQFHQIIRLP